MKFYQSVRLSTAGVALLGLVSVQAMAVDADAARKLAQQNNCLKCHSVDKDKDGPSYKKVAEKYGLELLLGYTPEAAVL